MKKILFVSLLLCEIYLQAMNSQNNYRSSIALEELVLFGKLVTSCLICVQNCNNASPSHKMQSFVATTAESYNVCVSNYSKISTSCCVLSLCYNNDESFNESMHERSSGNYSPTFHSHHNIYHSPRSLQD